MLSPRILIVCRRKENEPKLVFLNFAKSRNWLQICDRCIFNQVPFTLRELVVQRVFVVRVEVEDALNEVLAEHLRVLLEQPMKQAVFTQTATGKEQA